MGERGSGCGKIFMIGCGGVVVVLALIVLVVLLNLGRIRGVVESARETIDEALELQRELGQRFEAESVGVHLKRDSAAGATTLALRLVNPELDRGGDAELEAQSREVALFASRVIASPERYEAIEVELVWSLPGSAGTVTTTSSFRFPMGELMGHPEEGGGARPESEPLAERAAA
jgi:hypothetical protein